jgi:hypothetical protein
MVMDYNNFNKVNEDEDFLNDLLYGEESETSTMDKWQVLEKDIMNLVNKHSGKFGVDSYGVIDAIYQVMDQMFEKIEK